MSWVKRWFNDDYFALYAHRSLAEAKVEAKFIHNALALPKGSNILDIGCGEGRHAFPLAELGLNVTGIDCSKIAINRALNQLETYAPLTLRFIHSDLFDLESVYSYDAALSLFSSFGYGESEAENLRFLQAIRNHLKPEGYFFLDFLNPSYVRNHLIPKETVFVRGEKVEIRREIIGQYVQKTMLFPTRTYKEKVALYSKNILKKFLQQVGFNPLFEWGDFDGSPLHHRAKRQIFLCQKTFC